MDKRKEDRIEKSNASYERKSKRTGVRGGTPDLYHSFKEEGKNTRKTHSRTV